MLLILFVFISSLGWAIVDACKKFLTERMANLPIIIYLTFGQMLIFSIWASSEQKQLISPNYLIWAFASILVNIAANLMFMRSVSLSSFSATVPLLSLSPVFTTIAAFLFLDEMPKLLQLAGILVVVLGALILNLKFVGLQPLVTSLLKEEGAAWMMGVAALFSIGSTLDKSAIQFVSPAIHGVILSGGISLGLLMFLLYKRQMAQLKTNTNNLTLIGLGIFSSALALGFQLLASQNMLMSLFESLKTVVFLFLTLLIGCLAFKEKIIKQKFIAIFLMSLGTILMLR